jgi:hypothetical protein
LLCIDGSRLFNAKSTIRFPLGRITGPGGERVESIRALLAYRGKNLIETIRISHLPTPNSQTQRTRGDTYI